MAAIIDVSNFQGTVDWAQVVASGRAGAICKATEALGYVDPTFARNWQILGGMGATRGAYCFARPDNVVAEATADKFLSVVGPVKPSDILVLDIEVGVGNLSGWALTWLARVEAKTGVRPWLYSYAPFIRAHLTDQRLAVYPLWLAAYQTAPPACPPPWKNYVLWQHTDAATVPGVAGHCDESVGEISVAAPAPPPPPPPVEPVHDFEEGTMKSTILHIGPLDGSGNGWADFDPALGRDPIWISATLVGPSPPDDGGYWPGQAHVTVAAQPRGGKVRVVVRNGSPSDTIGVIVGAA